MSKVDMFFGLADGFSVNLNNNDCGFDTITLNHNNESFLYLTGNCLLENKHNQPLDSGVFVIFIRELMEFSKKVRRFVVVNHSSESHCNEAKIGHSFTVGNVNYLISLVYKKTDDKPVVSMMLEFNENTREAVLIDVYVDQVADVLDQVIYRICGLIELYLNTKNENIENNKDILFYLKERKVDLLESKQIVDEKEASPLIKGKGLRKYFNLKRYFS